MNRRAIAVLAVIFGSFFLLFLIFLSLAYMAMQGDMRSSGFTGGPLIGVLELRGQIGDSERGIDGSREAEQLRKLAADSEIKALVVRIDSPGGAVAPSQELWSEIRRIREKEGKPVVCSMGNLAASGGYYIAVACDRIVANPGTLTGSIGVITQLMEARQLVEAAKLVPHTLTTGAYKDAGNPMREFTEVDAAFFQQLLTNIHQQFMDAVAEGRNLDEEKVRELSDGRVFTGLQAKENGLVDELGNFRDALNLAMELAGVEGEPDLVYPERSKESLLRELLWAGARGTGIELVRGVVEGVEGSVQQRANMPQLLAPGLESVR